METTKKTKQQLLDEIEELKEEIRKLNKYEKYETFADETKAIHTALMNSGFTDEQAFELIKIFIANSTVQPKSPAGYYPKSRD